MPAQSRLGDLAFISGDAHCCPACPHPCVGPAIAASTDVFVNSMGALRLKDPGMHAACCDGNFWETAAGSGTVFINGKKAVRKDDKTKHCGGSGKMILGSFNVFTGG